MALTNVPRFRIPAAIPSSTGATTQFSSHVIDAVGEKHGSILRAPAAGTITKVAFRSGSHTTNGAADVRLEQVTTGLPSGTLLGTNSNGSQTINAANTWWTTTLTTGPTVAKGDLLAVVIEVAAASALNTNISSIQGGYFTALYPHIAHYTASWSKVQNSPVCALVYSGDVYHYTDGVYPFSAFSAPQYGSSSTPDEKGNRITLPYTARATGVFATIDGDAAFDIVLYDTDGTTALATISHNSDTRATTTAGTYYWPLPSAVTLNASSTYRIVAKPTTTTQIALAEFSVASSTIMTSAIPAGAECYFTSRTDAAATNPWAGDTTTTQASIGLEFDQIDISASGGGGPLIGGRLIR